MESRRCLVILSRTAKARASSNSMRSSTSIRLNSAVIVRKVVKRALSLARIASLTASFTDFTSVLIIKQCLSKDEPFYAVRVVLFSSDAYQPKLVFRNVHDDVLQPVHRLFRKNA